MARLFCQCCYDYEEHPRTVLTVRNNHLGAQSPIEDAKSTMVGLKHLRRVSEMAPTCVEPTRWSLTYRAANYEHSFLLLSNPLDDLIRTLSKRVSAGVGASNAVQFEEGCYPG